MNFGQAIGSGFGRYVDFQGRSSRSEFWYFLIFYYIALFVGFFSTGVIFSIAGENNPTADGFASLIDCLVVLVFALPSLAVQVRRLHDSNRSGWLCLLSLTVVGAIPVLIWLCTRGTMGENRFGRDPLDAASGRRRLGHVMVELAARAMRWLELVTVVEQAAADRRSRDRA